MIFFYIQLVYGQFPRTASTWCTYDVSLTYVNCAFNLFVDGEHKRLVVAVREISLRHLCKSNPTNILRVPWVIMKCNCSVRSQISRGNRGDCCACATATVRAYGKHVLPKSLDALAFLARFSFNFPRRQPVEARTTSWPRKMPLMLHSCEGYIKFTHLFTNYKGNFDSFL